MNDTIAVDLYSDPACPWCLVGLARLDLAIAALPEGVDVTIAHHPYLLDASAPLAGEDTEAMLRRKYGRDPAEAWDRLEVEAKSSGIELNMRLQKVRYASQPAQTLIAAAADRGQQHQLAKAIGDAYYLRGQNIADAGVLAEIASAYGFSAEQVAEIVTDKARWAAIERAAASANQQGVQGVPFFIFNQKFALSGAQPMEIFTQALGAALEDGQGAEAS